MERVQAASADYGRRNLPVVWFVVAAIVWVAIIKISGELTESRADLDDGRLLSVNDVMWALIVPLGAACIFVYLLITYLGWWRTVFYDPKPVRRWLWAIPIVFAICIALGINYGGLADRGLGFTLALLAAAMIVGFGEEGMFRAVGVTSFRRNGWSEGKVAFWTSVVFGLAHIANIIGGDPRAFGQAIAVSLAGYFFYLIRRVSRSNILNSILHGMFDFLIISGSQIFPEGETGYLGAGLALVVYIVCGALVFIRRHKIEPEGVPSAVGTL